MSHVLSFYQTHSPITDPKAFASHYDAIEPNAAAIARAVQGLIFHKQTQDLFQNRLSPNQQDELLLRSVPQMLGRILEVDPAPLTQEREPALRLTGNCRDFATLFVSICRHHGIPARLRVGFAPYFGRPEMPNADHWVAQWHDSERWWLVDPQLSTFMLTIATMQVDPLNLEPGRDFYFAGQMWQQTRAKEIHPRLYGFNRGYRGNPAIFGNLMMDWAALNKRELFVFDHWYPNALRKWTDRVSSDFERADQFATLTLAPDELFEQLQNSFATESFGQIIDSKLRLLGITDSAEQADLNTLSDRSTFFGTSDPTPLPQTPAPAAAEAAQLFNGLGDIVIRGARQHNLKNIDVTIPRHKLVVVTGVSGSGKSSLALDTLYAEGQRRYVESLSSYARQFLGQMEKPQVDQITGLSPAIAIEQKTVSRNPRSTVGTVTEILDYLRVLFARIGVPHCPECGRDVQPQTPLQIAEQLLSLPANTRFQLIAPVVRKRKGTHKKLLQQALKDGTLRARVNGDAIDLRDDIPTLDKNKPHTVELVIDRLAIRPTDTPEDAKTQRQRVIDSVETTLKAGNGTLIVDLGDRELLLSEHHACPDCDLSFSDLSPALFSFNSPFGMCPECNGLGVKMQVSADLIVPQPHLSLMDGASPYYGELRKKKDSWTLRTIQVIADHYDADITQPWNDLPEAFRTALLYGSDGVKFNFKFENEREDSWSGEVTRDAKGVIFHINRLFRQTKSDWRRRWLAQFMAQQPCPVCHGERLCPEARYVTVDDKRLPELSNFSINDCHKWIARLLQMVQGEQREIAEELLGEIEERLRFLLNVGLHYLTLDRPAPTLSGGESQRIRLASQLGSGLVGVLYILDEPSIGLHARDQHALLQTLLRLRDMGNTVVVIEHDEETMRSADYIIDLGPRAGVLGGEVIAEGTPAAVMALPDSLTGGYLSGRIRINRQADLREPIGWLSVIGAERNNLKQVDARFPLGVLCCVTGVSGSGKSSLVTQTLYPALSRTLHNAKAVPGKHHHIDGIEQIDKVIHITQDPIGRTPRSNPATYVGLFDEIRKLFARLPESKARGYKAGRFSFNSKGGRCEDCQGHGRKKVEMHFLADVWVMCHTCGGARFNRPTLEISYRDRTIADVLNMDVQEALHFFDSHKKIKRMLSTLNQVGLDYLKLGQSALTLSGGEAQRVKLAKELSRPETGRTLYILDEPTTGLHFADIQRLLDVLHALVELGNSVLVIEHNLDVIANADYLIDLGPEGGDGGGVIVASGTPAVVAASGVGHTGRFLVQHI